MNIQDRTWNMQHRTGGPALGRSPVLPAVYRLLPTVLCLLSAVYRLLPTVLCLLFTVFCLPSALADTHYVDINSTNATPPYTNWATAATVIQDAVDEAVDGDTVLVTDGVYSNGGYPVHGDLQSRVAVRSGQPYG